jgi:signal transduction histidine kinase
MAMATAAGVAVTLVSLLPVTSVAYRSPTLHVAIETAATLIAVLGAVLILGRFLRAGILPDLVLAGSLLLLGLTNLCFAVVPWTADDQLGSFDTWTPISGRLLGALGLAAGAMLPLKPVRRPRRAAGQMLGVVLAALLAIGVAGALLAPHLPAGIDPDLPPDPSGPDLVGNPGVLVSQIAGLVLYAVATVGFSRRAWRTGDELMSWLAAAATAAAFSRLNYFLFPSIYSEWIYAGDLLRLTFYVLILVGALREIAAYQRDLAEVAVYRERRRMARDLHDGIAQDLAFITTQARRLRGREQDPASQIALAAKRALDESRHSIATLARPVDASLGETLAQAAEEMAAREGVRLRFDLAPDIRAPDEVHDALMRIVREAVGNAIRHGGAKSVELRLARSDGLRLTIENDGAGLPPEGLDSPGFGLVSMRERADALGGRVRVSPGREGGVCVEVWLP